MNQRRYAGYIFKFLAILLALTLIARGTSGVTLARVVLETPMRSQIIDAISGSAIVQAVDYIEITLPTDLEASEIKVNVGQNIETGDAIAAFDLTKLEEIRLRETAVLDRMVLDLEIMNRGENIDTAQRNLRRAQEDYENIVAQGEADIIEAMEATPSTLRTYERALQDLNAAKAQGEADIAAAELALSEAESNDTAIQTAMRNHQRALEDYYATREQSESDIQSAESALAEIQNRRTRDSYRTAIETARRNLERARADYNTTRQQTEEAIWAAERALMTAWSTYPHDATAAFAALTQAQNNANTMRTNAARQVEDAEANLAQAQQNFDNSNNDELENAENALQTAKTRAENNLLSAMRILEDAEVNLSQAHENFENNINTAATALENTQNQVENSLQVAQRRLEDAAIEDPEVALQNAITRAEDNRRQASRHVEDAAAALQNAQRTAMDTEAQNAITASVLQLDIAAKQARIYELDELIYSGGIMFSQYNGIISSTNAPFITFRDTSNGNFEARMQISRTQAESLSVGSESEVTTSGGNLFFTPTVVGIVSSISQPDEYNRVDITISLPEGNWSVGQRVDAQITLSRENHDFAVPISALHSDNAGYFLHIVEERNTIMGLQNIVFRTYITVIAYDTHMVAVQGAVGRDSQVITSSNKPISEGDRVRME
ncbi:MAG: hypothetical protein FWF81_09890 [Defluviitaleaceae bacterium]|nr:hypothetical protein [Defluviitaleaceae bacterium]